MVYRIICNKSTKAYDRRKYKLYGQNNFSLLRIFHFILEFYYYNFHILYQMIIVNVVFRLSSIVFSGYVWKLYRAHPRQIRRTVEGKLFPTSGNNFRTSFCLRDGNSLTLGVTSQLSLSLTLSQADTNSPYYSNDSAGTFRRVSSFAYCEIPACYLLLR